MAAINSYEAHDVPEVLERNDRLKSLPLLTAGIIFPLAFLGLIITRPRSAVILYLYLLAYLVSFLIMYVTPRFRLPVVPVLLLFAAAALLRLIEQLRQKQWKTFTRNMIVLLPLFVLVNLRPPDIRRDRNISRPAFLYEWRGLTRMKEREWEKAAEAFEKALRLNPDSLRARSNLKLLKQKLANGD